MYWTLTRKNKKIKPTKTKQKEKISKIIIQRGRCKKVEGIFVVLFVYICIAIMFFFLVCLFFFLLKNEIFSIVAANCVYVLCRVFISSAYNGGWKCGWMDVWMEVYEGRPRAGGNVISKAKPWPPLQRTLHPPTYNMWCYYIVIVVREKQHTLSSWKSSPKCR